MTRCTHAQFPPPAPSVYLMPSYMTWIGTRKAKIVFRQLAQYDHPHEYPSPN
jgi:hypothetical protein